MQGITNKKQFTSYILIIAAIVLVVNVVSRSLFFRLDLTDNKMYSLSESSKKVIEKLEDRLLAKVYFSSDLPGQVANSRRYLQDMLEEYAAYSKGDFHFEFIAPDKNEQAKEDARSYGIPPVQMQVVENDKLEIKNVYMGLVLLYEDKKELLPVIQTTDGLEYEITTAIKKITSSGMNRIAIAESDNASVETKKLTELLRQTYTVKAQNLDNPISVDTKVLLVNGFTDSLSLESLYNLDQYLMGGGKVMLSQARQTADLQQGRAQDIQSNIFDFLEHYGVRIGNDIITDKKCGQIQVQQQQGFFRMVNAIEYPVFPVINQFNKEDLSVKSLESARLFFPNEISSADSSINLTWLMKSSNNTGVITGPYYNIYPIDNPMMKIFPGKSKVLAARLNGHVNSYFANNVEFNTREGFLTQNAQAELVIIGDLEFFNDKRAGGIPENSEFIQNSIDVLSGDSELVEIRSRGVSSRPLETITDGKRQTWKWVNILLPALLVIFMGFYRMKKNRDRREMLEEMYM